MGIQYSMNFVEYKFDTPLLPDLRYELVNYSEGFKQPDNGYLQYIDNGELIFWEDSPTDTDYPSASANPERQDFSNQHELWTTMTTMS